MKKFLAVLTVLAMLLAPMAINASAAATYELSMNAVEANRGDEVVIEVSLDTNPGIWGCIFNIVYDPAYFDLVKVENAGLFPVATYDEPDDSGSHSFFGEAKGTANLKGNPTGVMAKYTFKVLKTAPAGVHVIDLYVQDGGDGYFLDATDVEKEVSVELTKQGTITVNVPEEDTTVDTDVDTGVDTDKNDETTVPADKETFAPPATVYPDNNSGTGDKETDSGSKEETEKTPVTEAPAEPVTDADGSTVEETTTLGELITNPEETSPDKEYVTDFVYDENSELVLDIEGKPQIGYREVIRGENDNSGAVNAIIYVVAGVLVVGAAAVVATVAVVNQKKKK